MGFSFELIVCKDTQTKKRVCHEPVGGLTRARMVSRFYSCFV